MANGRTHEAINIGALGALGAGTALLTHGFGDSIAETVHLTPGMQISFVVAYAIGTFLVTPDLDLAHQSVRAKKHWGFLGIIWIPYGLIFKHRGISHSWLIGPLTRLLYLLLLGFAVKGLTSAVAPTLPDDLFFEVALPDDWAAWALAAFIGYMISQWVHLIVDRIPMSHGASRTRKQRKGKRRKR